MSFRCGKCGMTHKYEDSRDNCEHWGRYRTDGKKVSLQQALAKILIFNIKKRQGFGLSPIADILPDLMFLFLPPPPPPTAYREMAREDERREMVDPLLKEIQRIRKDNMTLSTYEKDGKTYLRVTKGGGIMK